MTKVPFPLGDGEVCAVVHEKIRARPTMLNVHDDEDTSVAAGLADIAQHSGRVIELAHSGERLITFTVGGQKYSFDPNRIFSDAGITATLKKHSVYSAAAHAEIKSFCAGPISGILNSTANRSSSRCTIRWTGFFPSRVLRRRDPWARNQRPRM